MKRIALLFMVAMLVMFGVLVKAQAKENMLEFNFYEYDKFDDLDERENIIFNILINTKLVDVKTTVNDDTGESTHVVSNNGKTFLTVVDSYDSSTNSYNTISEELDFNSFTKDDDIEYYFSELEKEDIAENPDDPFKGYDGIIVHFSNKPGTVLIKKIELIERTGMAVINSPATIDGLNINVDVKFKDVNDKVVYKALVKNNTENDYYLTKGNINNTDEYIKYEFDYDEDNDVIKAGETRYVTITMSYDKEVPTAMLSTGKYQSAQKLGLTLSTEKEEIVAEANPKTVDGVMKAVLVLAISVVLLVIMIKVRALRKAMMVVLALVMIMPAVAKAIEKLDITINTKAEVTTKPSFGVYTIESNEPTYYEYEEGMTWEEWLDSEYNTDDLSYIFVSGEEDYFKCVFKSLPSTSTTQFRSAQAPSPISLCDQYQHKESIEITDNILPVSETYYGVFYHIPDLADTILH